MITLTCILILAYVILVLWMITSCKCGSNGHYRSCSKDVGIFLLSMPALVVAGALCVMFLP